MTPKEREVIAALWSEKLAQDARGLPKAERHRNLEPASAEFICALACQRLKELELADHVDFVLADAGRVLGQYEALELVLIDCEKDDYVPFLGLLKLSPGAFVVADNILSHDLREYMAAVRAYPGVESVTLPIGKGLEVSRFVSGSPGRV